MNILLIYAHPSKKSFSETIKNTAVDTLEKKGYNVNVRDLYAMNFNPVLSAKDIEMLANGDTPADIKIEQELISKADGIVFVYPTWWENMPAVMRGYVDKVFSLGFAYAYTDDGPVGLLKGKKALALQTTGSPAESLEPLGLIEAMKTGIGTGIFGFVGLENVGHKFFHAVASVDDASRKTMLVEIETAVDKAF